MTSSVASKEMPGSNGPFVFDADTVAALGELAEWSSNLSWNAASGLVQDRLTLILFDTLVASRAGAATQECSDLRTAWPTYGGPATVIGATRSGSDRAAWLNGAAAVSLELDPANRTTRGHAAAHVVFAVLGVAEEIGATGIETLGALLVSHEIASRFGRASRLHPGLHPHGSWGAIGAAAGVARLLGLGPERTAVAMDNAGGLMLAAPFGCVDAGSPVRNHWVGFSNHAGIMAARIATGFAPAPVSGMAYAAFQLALGTLDPSQLVDGLGVEYAVTTDFVKRHASCGYTHAVLDAVLEVQGEAPGRLDPMSVDRIVVGTNSLGVGLSRMQADTRLSAMFSIPYMVAAALVLGDTGPVATNEESRGNPMIRALGDRVEVVLDADLESRMPLDRGAWVEVLDRDGQAHRAEVPNAIGDPRHHPATWSTVQTKADALLQPLGVDTGSLLRQIRSLESAPDLCVLSELSSPDSGERKEIR